MQADGFDYQTADRRLDILCRCPFRIRALQLNPRQAFWQTLATFEAAANRISRERAQSVLRALSCCGIQHIE